MARNIINIEGVSKAFDIRPLLVDVSLGISEGERIGIVGMKWWWKIHALENSC